MKEKTFEKYPVWMMLVYYFFSFSVYLAGLYLLYLILPLFALLFFIYILYLEVKLLREGCVRCYYYGKRCVCGKGKVAKVFFKKDEKRKFYEREVTMKDMIPSFLPMIITLIAGMYLVIQGLPIINFPVIGIAVWPLIVTFFGNPIIYGKMSCPHCKQRELGCPACEFFMRVEKKGKK
ncbi:MAG: hypothetical protein GTN38_02730 [Candidatus Aenigmarchaeota archaeon]|nr:hypothetical protein [Candidatus Aenigmarchaeota archaeon]NIP40552.1 hypothetical protein [Candidatus Aenigmarchaeota archaeon]NIQ18397.1 hypothetical protein [Candidatus Aenigmarchaeota archaeon]